MPLRDWCAEQRQEEPISHVDMDDWGEIQAILNDNNERLSVLNKTHDQLTGEGIEGHTWCLSLYDFYIRNQWLTDEFRTNPFFAKLAECGGIVEFRAWYKQEYGTEISRKEIEEEIVKRRLERDPAFAFRVCFQIADKVSGEMMPFILNYPQRYVLYELEKMRIAGVPIRLVILKARQWGGSTLVQLYMAWLQIFVCDGWNSVIIAQTKDTSRRIKGMYRKVLDNFPKFVFNKNLQFSSYEQSQGSDFCITDIRHQLVRSSVVTVASYENYENTRGAAVSMAHCSECAYWKSTETKSAEKLITSIDGGILPIANTMIVLESTANGNSGHFYDTYQLGKSGKDTLWHSIFIPFFYIENDMIKLNYNERLDLAREIYYNRNEETAKDECHESGKYIWELWEKGATLDHIAWYIKKRSAYTTHEQMASEAPSDDVECFASSGGRVWSMYHVEKLRKLYSKKYQWCGDIRHMSEKTYNGFFDVIKIKYSLLDKTIEDKGELRIWKHPDAIKTANQYLVVVDVGGRSDKADYSVITVFNRWHTLRGGELEVVARWRGHLRYDLMAFKAVAIAMYYKNALLVFESNTFDKKQAEATDYIDEGDHIRGILNVIGDSYDNLYTRPNKDEESIKQGVDTLIGFQTNKKTKQDIVDEFTVMFEDGGFCDPDARFYAEAEIYERRPNGSYGNIVGKGNHDDIVMTDMIGVYVHNRMDVPALVS